MRKLFAVPMILLLVFSNVIPMIDRAFTRAALLMPTSAIAAEGNCGEQNNASQSGSESLLGRSQLGFQHSPVPTLYQETRWNVSIGTPSSVMASDSSLYGCNPSGAKWAEELIPPIVTLDNIPDSGWKQAITAAYQTWNNGGTPLWFAQGHFNSDEWAFQLGPNGSPSDVSLALGEVRFRLVRNLDEDFIARAWPVLQGVNQDGSDRKVASLIEINTRYDFSVSGTPSSAQIDLQSAIVHELGHVAGMDHVLLPLNSVMFCASGIGLCYGPGTVKRDLASEDSNCLVSLYGLISPISYPSTPALLSPASSSTVANPVTFRWSSVSGAMNYYIQISKHKDFDPVLFSRKVSSPDYQPPFSFGPGATYYWRVKASNGHRNSVWTATDSFIVASPSTNVDSAAYVSDVTYPDEGPPVSPGQAIVKTWRLRNVGTTTWGSGYKLKFKRGDQMGAPDEVSVQTTGPNGTADISVNMTAPADKPGRYKGYWQMWSPVLNGVFGPEIWIQVEVPDNSQTPQTGDIILKCLDCPGVVTPGQQFRPTIQARIVNGALLQSRGDMLRHTSEPYYSDFPHIGVVGNHYAGETYSFQFYADHPVVAPTAEGTYESKWRIWRNGNWAGDEYTIRFVVRNGGGTLPNVPTLSSPADGWTDFGGCPTSPQLCVQSQGGSIQFNFHVDPSAPQTSGWVSGSCWTPSSLGQTEHIWQVKARDASTGLESGWSNQRRFTCASTNYLIPYMLFSPSSPTSADAVKLWTCADVPSEVGRGIEVYANTATDGSNSGEWRRVWPVLNGDCTADWQNHPEWWPSEDLRFLSNGTHLIQARAWAGPRDNPIKSMVREASYTLLDNRRPAQVRQLSPESRQWLNIRTITFRWEPEEAPRSQSFVLKVSADPNPAVNPIVNQTLSGTTRVFTYTFDQDYAALYWGIQACNSYGCSDMGSVQFGIDRLGPSSFVNTLPITIYDTVQTVIWSCGDQNLSGCQRYDVQVRDDALGQWQGWRSGVTEVSGLFRGLPGHHYCFRARALDNAANLEDWPTNPNGDTCTLIDLDNQPQTWWNASYRSKRKLTVLNWDSHTLNTGFPVHVRFDGTTMPTAAEIYSASQAAIKGDDVRVVYQNTTEVSRFIQTFTPNGIDIWFDLQADVGPNPGNSAEYQLYYGNPSASNPPANPGDVFMPRRDSGVVAAWYFSEWGGSTAADNSGNGHTATRVNGGQWVTTARGPAIDLVKDSKQYLMVNDPASLNLTNFTFEAWFWRDHSDVGALISKWRDGEDDSSYLFGIWQRKMMLRLRSPSGQFFETPEGEQGGFSFEDNQGYHVAATYDGSKVRFYVNGELKYTKDWTGSVRSSGKNVFLGVQQSPNGDPPYSLDGYFDGLVSGIRISNYARTSFPYASFALVTNAPQVSAGAESAYESPTIQPDLAVLSLTTYPAPTSQGGGQIVQAVVKNQGTRATRNGAWTLAYADHLPTVGDLNGISFWLGTPIEAGAIATLTTYITRTSVLHMMLALGDQALAESNHTLYVQADATGVTKDSNRANNISTGAQVCLANADVFEPNDTAADAITLALGSTMQLNFHGTEDQDWFKFIAPKGVTLTIQTSNLGIAADTYLYLYNTDRTTLLGSNDDYDGSFASRIGWAAPVTGTYYLMARGWNPNVGGCGTGYDLSVTAKVPNRIYLPVVSNSFNPPNKPTVTAIAAGDGHTCALTVGGEVKCWGGNGFGQLGDGTTTNRLTPVKVSELLSDITAIAAGGAHFSPYSAHTCAVTAAGGVTCWGNNQYGQLGDGTISQRLTPVDVVGLTSRVRWLAAGGYHTCVLTAMGGAKCWGQDYFGQLGDGRPTWYYATPKDVSGLSSGVIAIMTGQWHTCALTDRGEVKCWGDNHDGQLGDGTSLTRNVPVNVSGLSNDVAAITTGGWHTCALTRGGGVKCWGNNPAGQLGDGTTTQRLTPVDVSGLSSGVTAITAGGFHTCALTRAGGAKCWGGNDYGELGDGTTTSRSTPVDVSGLTGDVAAIVAGINHTCALTHGGGVKCWGANEGGQLGDSTTTNRNTPVDVVGLSSGLVKLSVLFVHGWLSAEAR